MGRAAEPFSLLKEFHLLHYPKAPAPISLVTPSSFTLPSQSFPVRPPLHPSPSPSGTLKVTSQLFPPKPHLLWLTSLLVFRSSPLLLYCDTRCLPRLTALKSMNRRGWAWSTKPTDSEQWLLFSSSPQTQRAKPSLPNQQHSFQPNVPTIHQLTKGTEEHLSLCKSWPSTVPQDSPSTTGSLPSPKKVVLGRENRKVISCYKYLEVIVLLVWVVRGCKKIQRHRGELNWEERVTIKSPFKRFAKKGGVK